MRAKMNHSFGFSLFMAEEYPEKSMNESVAQNRAFVVSCSYLSRVFHSFSSNLYVKKRRTFCSNMHLKFHARLMSLWRTYVVHHSGSYTRFVNALCGVSGYWYSLSCFLHIDLDKDILDILYSGKQYARMCDMAVHVRSPSAVYFRINVCDVSPTGLLFAKICFKTATLWGRFICVEISPQVI